MLQRVGCDLGPAGANGRLDQFRQRHGRDAQLILRDRLLRGGKRHLVLAETVVEKRARVLAGGQDRTVTAGGRVTLERLLQNRRLGLVTTRRGEHQPADDAAGVAGRRDDRVGLVQQRRRRVEVALRDPHPREKGGDDRKHAQRARVPGVLSETGGDDVPRLVVEQLDRDASGPSRAVQVLPVAGSLLAERLQRPLENRRRRRVAVGEPSGQTIDEQVGCTRRLLCGRRGASGLGRILDAAAEAAGDARRPECLQVRLARERAHRAVRAAAPRRGAAVRPRRRD